MFHSIINCINVPVAELRLGSVHRSGTLENLREAVEDDEHPRILNMLSLPMGHLSQEPPPKYRLVSISGADGSCSPF
jgi:hypothetical protein